MPSVEEMVGGVGSPLHDALVAGIADISQQQSVTFSLYTRYVLPLDGFLFWLKTGEFCVQGAIHWQSERYQAEDETATRNSIVFTCGEALTDLNTGPSDTLIVGDIDGQKYSFMRQGWFFPPASIWHYVGDALQPSELTQLVEHPSQLNPQHLIVSNSLPAWLAMANYNPHWLEAPKPRHSLFPSFFVPGHQL